MGKQKVFQRLNTSENQEITKMGAEEIDLNRFEINEEITATFKIIMIGNSGVGKSCLIMRGVNDEFNPVFISTIGVDFCNYYIRLDNKAIVKLMIWDTAGQERFKAITKAYFRGAHAVMIVYDVNNRESFDHVDKWLKDKQENSNYEDK